VPDPAPAAGRPRLLRDLRLKGGRGDNTHHHSGPGPGPAGRPARPSPARCAGPRRSPGPPRPAAAVRAVRPGARIPRRKTSVGRPGRGDEAWLTSTPCIAACSRPTRLAMPRPWPRWRGRCMASSQRQPPIWARCGPGSGFMRPRRTPAAGGGRPCEEPRPTPARRLRRRTAQPHGEMSVQLRKLTAAASVSPGATEPPAQTARPSGNGQRQVSAASPRLGSGAPQPSPTGGPSEGHRCWPRPDSACLPAAGPAALSPVASLGPDLPCTDDPSCSSPSRRIQHLGQRATDLERSGLLLVLALEEVFGAALHSRGCQTDQQSDDGVIVNPQAGLPPPALRDGWLAKEMRNSAGDPYPPAGSPARAPLA
jgi:hypothetical protein